MLKASAPATWRKEIRARCQQISTSTWLTGQTHAHVCYIQNDSGATPVIFQERFCVKFVLFFPFFLRNLPEKSSIVTETHAHKSCPVVTHKDAIEKKWRNFAMFVKGRLIFDKLFSFFFFC